ncbi:hypothetical protein BDQ17DRAFT_1333387 [Cyathus striatus]|nr:hypothetical protein BDQ17DRAFT_1333387 [Cyathus striatus]
MSSVNTDPAPSPAPKKKASEKGDKKPLKRCIWTDEDDAILVGIMKDLKVSQQAENGWKGTIWKKVEAALADKGSQKGAEKTAVKCEDHFGNLKDWYNELKYLQGLSGFGWDDTAKHKNPKYSVWCKKTFPLFNDIGFIVGKTVATGTGAFHAGVIAKPEVVILLENPAPNSHKHLRADSDTAPKLQYKQLKHQKSNDSTPKHAAEAMSGIADALQYIGDSMHSSVLSMLEHHKKATQMVESDVDLTEKEQICAL